MRRCIALTMLLILGALVGGCGSSARNPHSTTSAASHVVVPPNLVTNADIAATQAGSPRQATLQWFQAVQFQDVVTLRRLTSPGELNGLSDTTLASWLSDFGAAFPRPSITAVTTSGDVALVRMLLLSYRAPSRVPLGALPFTLRLRRSGDTWLVADASLLKSYARATHLTK
jgi:hypothetical protein